MNKHYEVMTLVRRAKLGNPGRKAVLMVLAEHCGEDANGDWSCYPSQGTIAEQVELGERQVRTILADFEREGLIKRQHRGRPGQERGGRTSDRITLDLDAIARLLPATTAGKVAATQPEVKPDPTGSSEPPNRKPTSGEEVEQENNPPYPPQAGGEASHTGQHPNCRQCGTNRRGPKADPPPPGPRVVDQEVAGKDEPLPSPDEAGPKIADLRDRLRRKRSA